MVPHQISRLGALTFLLACAQILLLIESFGGASGIYFWVPHLALLSLGASLWFQSRTALIVVVSVSLLPQTLYFLDQTIRAVGGFSPWGFSEFLFHPGLTKTAFVLGQNHWLYWPCTILGFLVLPKTKRKNSKAVLWGVAVSNVFLWVGSYTFGIQHNVNCVYQACFRVAGSLSPFFQQLVWVGGFFAISMTLAFGFTRLKVLRSGKPKFFAVIIFSMVCLSIASLAQGLGIPRLFCEAPFEDPSVRIGCSYTSEFGPGKMMLAYKVWNKGLEPRYCDSRILMNNVEQALHDRIWAEPGVATEIWVVVPYPKQNTSARLIASCDKD